MKRQTALLIDLSQKSGPLLDRLVQEAGFITVSETTNFETAWERANAVLFDVVFVDIALPDDGLVTFLKRMRAEFDQGRQPPVIAVTSDTQRATIERLLGAGVQAVLAKPFSRSVLEQQMARAFAQRDARLREHNSDDPGKLHSDDGSDYLLDD